MQDLQTNWLQCGWKDASWFASVRVARDGQRVVLKASRSGYLVGLILLALAVGVWFLGDTLAFPRWFLAVMVGLLVVGALFSPIAVAVMLRLFVSRMSIDPQSQLVTIRSPTTERSISFDDVVAMQYLAQKGGAQINLAYRDGDESVDRTCLYAHANAKYVLAIAREFAPLVRWPVVNADGQSVG